MITEAEKILTNANQLGLVPDPDFCTILAEYNFPQATKFYWATSRILTKQGDEVWVLLTADELAENGLKPGQAQCYAAPVCEEFMRVTPLQHYVMFAKFGYIFVDLMQTMLKSKDVEGTAPKEFAMTFHRIKEADAQTAANCWAKGFCYLLLNKKLGFKKREEAQ